MLDKINSERHEHILTIEDPIEYIHQHKNCLVNQRECTATPTASATRSAAPARGSRHRPHRRNARPGDGRSGAEDRRDGPPDVRHAAHELAAQTINRIIDVFPAGQQAQIRTQLSLVLEGIVCQALLPRADGKGRVCSLEIMIPTPAIRNLIRDDKIHQIYGSMQAGQEKLGMQTANQSLASLYLKRLITLDAAMMAASNKDELQDMINRGVGVVAGAGLGRTAGRRRGRCEVSVCLLSRTPDARAPARP